MASNLVEDIKQVREGNKSATIDVSELVKQHIPEGTKRDLASNHLQQLGFSLHWTPNPKNATETLLAIYKEKGIKSQLGFTDEIRVVIEFKENAATSITGKIIYRAL